MSKDKEDKNADLKLVKGELDWHQKYNLMIERFTEDISNKIHVGSNPPSDNGAIWIRLRKGDDGDNGTD